MALTEIDKISAGSNIITNPSPVDASNITTQLNGRATKVKVLTTSTCEVKTALDGGPNVSGNTNTNAGNNNNGGNQGGGNAGGETEPVETITFTIDGKEYQAEKGMTWEEWIASDYNNSSCTINVDNAVWIECITYIYANSTFTKMCYKDEVILSQAYYGDYSGY